MTKRNRRTGAVRTRRKKSSLHPMQRFYRSSRVEQLEARVVFSHDGTQPQLFTMPADEEAQAIANAAAGGVLSPSPFPDITVTTTLANGMPVLDSYPNAPSAIFLDFDGDLATTTDPYDRDGSPTTFNTQEQNEILEAWRQVSIYFAMFNVKVVTTPVDLPMAWIAIGNNIDNAYSGVNVFPDNGKAESWSQSSYARTRITALPHELGHNFGSWHISRYDNLGNKTAEYSDAFDPLHGVMMGLDYRGVIHKWSAWHDSTNIAVLQDDMARIAADLDNPGGDGYRPDDYSGTIATATPLTVLGNTQSRVGIIERLTDADSFSFTSTGGRYAIMVGRDAPSGVDVKVSVYNSAGVLVATDDGDPRKQPFTMVNDSHLTLDLAAGTYYVIVQSHGNYADQGQYIVRVDQMASGWNSAAVGLVGIPGYTNYDSTTGKFIVGGSGDDIWGSADSFHYLHQTLTGDGSITVRVDSLNNTDGSAKAGIMIRESLAEGSKNAMLEVKPGNTTHFQYRTGTGGSSTSVNGPTGSNARWLRLTRTGNSIKAEVSSSTSATPPANSWSTVGTQTVSMTSTVYIGLATTSHNNIRLNTATYSNVSLTGSINAPATPNNLPAPTGLTVSSTSSNSVGLSWAGIAVPGDLNGDSAVNSTDLNLVKTNFGSVGAVGAPGDANGDGVVDIADYNLVKNSIGVAPTGYAIERSSDGVNFAQVGATAVGVTTFTNTGLSDALKYFYRVRTLNGTTVSNPSSVVSPTTRAGAVGNLNVISTTASQLIVTWSDASGESSYRLERSPDGTSGWTSVTTPGKNVPMYVNNGLTVGTQYFYRVVTVDGSGDAAISSVASGWTRLAAVTGLVFTNKASNQMAIAWNAVTGATRYTVERSSDNTNWTTLSTNQTGLTYADNSVVPVEKYYYRVTPSNTSVPGETATTFAASPSATELPNGLISVDIGVDTTGGARTGAAGVNGSTVTVVGGGSDIWGTSDQFRYTYVSMTGNGSITARVASVDDTNYFARAGVMIRNSTASASRYAAVMVHQSDFGVRLQYRTSTSSDNNGRFSAETDQITNPSPASQAAPYWVRLTRTGTTFLAQASADGVTWFTVGSQTISMNNTVRIGLAVTPRENSAINKAVFDNVTIVRSTGTIVIGGSAASGSVASGGGSNSGNGAAASPSSSSKPKGSIAGGISLASQQSTVKKLLAGLSKKESLALNAEDEKKSSSKPRRLTAIDNALASWLDDRRGSASSSLAKASKANDAFFQALGREA